MKQILPILTLTTLTAAAFADAGAAAPAAAASGLSYNRVGISRSSDQTSLSVSQLLGSSNFLATLSTRNTNNTDVDASNYAFLSVGYVFKNVVAGIDATASIGTSSNGFDSNWSINLRRSLSEVFAGLEVALAYSHQKEQWGSTQYGAKSWTYELAYNINKQYSVAYALTDFSGNSNENVHAVSLRYNF